jgi:hypothetical protein
MKHKSVGFYFFFAGGFLSFIFVSFLLLSRMADNAPQQRPGVSRSLTKEFVRLRQEAAAAAAAAAEPDDGVRGNRGSDVDVSELQRLYGEVTRHITSMEGKLTSLKIHMTGVKQTVDFESTSFSKKMDLRSQVLMDDIDREVRETKSLVDQMGTLARRHPSLGPMCKNMQKRCATELTGIVVNFRKVQTMIRAHYDTSYSTFNLYENDSEDDDEERTLMSVDLRDAEDHCTVVKKRAEDIEHLCSQMEELQHIFSDLQTLLIDQGTVLDRIEEHMDNSVSYTEQGTVHIQKAAHYQKEGSYKLVCILFFVLIVALIVFGIAYGSSKKK